MEFVHALGRGMRGVKREAVLGNDASSEFGALSARNTKILNIELR